MLPSGILHTDCMNYEMITVIRLGTICPHTQLLQYY